MEPFAVKIAESVGLVEAMFGSTREYFKSYLTEQPADFSVTVTAENLGYEQKKLDEEADREGLRRRKFTAPFLERAAIQRAFAAELLPRGVLLLHGSTVVVDGRGYLFTADTGVGKSTHTRLWRELLGDRAVMLNDDRAFIRPTPGGATAWGSPWSGKHGLDTNLSVPLAGICILERGSENSISPMPEAFDFLLKQCFEPTENSREINSGLLSNLCTTVPLWHLSCTKTLPAAQLAYSTMSGCSNPTNGIKR